VPLGLRAGFPTVNAASSKNTLRLGDLLYADPSLARVAEKDWLALIRAVAGGDQEALRVLHEKTYPLIFTYLIRLTGNRELTDAVIVDVYQDIWCEAPLFNGSDGPVLGWIMKRARAAALARRAPGQRSDLP
jgi:RNA polymerase sigma-70 factor, ECF subfamily